MLVVGHRLAGLGLADLGFAGLVLVALGLVRLELVRLGPVRLELAGLELAVGRLLTLVRQLTQSCLTGRWHSRHLYQLAANSGWLLLEWQIRLRRQFPMDYGMGLMLRRYRHQSFRRCSCKDMLCTSAQSRLRFASSDRKPSFSFATSATMKAVNMYEMLPEQMLRKANLHCFQSSRAVV
jgi:hypothetical protein